MKCTSCRKAEVLDTWLDKIRVWCFRQFKRDLEDFRMDFYTQGISEGYKLGFQQAKDLAKPIEEPKDDRATANALLKQLYCTVSEEDVLTILEDKVGRVKLLYLNGEQISSNEWAALIEEVKFIEATRFWKIMTNTLAEQARLRMFENAKVDADLLFGKAMLWVISVQKKLIEKIKQFKT